MMLHHNNRKVMNTKVGIREWAVAMKSMTMLRFLKGCERLWNYGLEKQFNAVVRVQNATLVGVWKMVLLNAKQTRGLNQEVSGRSKDLNSNWATGYTCVVLTKKMAAFCLCPKNLSRA